jgi:hypothetical protein
VSAATTLTMTQLPSALAGVGSAVNDASGKLDEHALTSEFDAL